MRPRQHPSLAERKAGVSLDGSGNNGVDKAIRLDDFRSEIGLLKLVKQMVMIVSLQLDSYHYKCKSCHKLHLGPTRTFNFSCVEEKMTEQGPERIYEAAYSSVCDCTQIVKITFRVREHPEGIFDYDGYHSSDAEIIIDPKVREHVDFVDV